MRFASLGSGSRGNATLVEAGGVRVLVDCGFALCELERRLELLGVEPQRLDAVLTMVGPFRSLEIRARARLGRDAERLLPFLRRDDADPPTPE